MTTRNLFQNHQELHQLILDHITDLIGVISVRGKFLYVSPSHKSVVGYDPEELAGKDAIRFFHKDDQKDLRKKLLHCVASRKTLHSTARFRHKDGQWIYLDGVGTPILNSLGIPEMVLVTSRDITEQKEMQEQIHHLALHDALTGLPNRTLFYDRFNQALASTSRRQIRGGIIMADLDHFKEVNDRYGHQVGDQMLFQAGERFRRALRSEDTVARLGGDEFVMLIPRLTQEEDILKIMRKIIRVTHQPFLINDQTVKGSVTLGAAIFPDSGTDYNTLLQRADMALYEVKSNGRDGYKLAS